MGRADWTTREIELAVRSALVDGGFLRSTETGAGFVVSTLLADVIRAGEGIVEVAHVPSVQATRERIAAYRAALQRHAVNKVLWCHIVAVGPTPEYRLWVGCGVRFWPDEEEESLDEEAKADLDQAGSAIAMTVAPAVEGIPLPGEHDLRSPQPLIQVAGGHHAAHEGSAP